MMNREKYQRAFRPVRPSRDIYTEVLTMTKKKRHFSKALVSVCVAAVLIVAGATAAYATDLGGFRQMVTMWIGGEQKSGIMKQVGEGKFVFTDEDGKNGYYAGTIIGTDEDGNDFSRGLTLEEFLDEDEMKPHAYVDIGEDGSVWLCYREERTEITDQVKDGGVARATFEHDGETLYVAVTADGKGNFSLSEGTDGFSDQDTLLAYEN